jgi:oligopeptide transport system permease protein
MRSAAAPVPLSRPRAPRRGAWTRFYARFSHNPLHVVAAGFAVVIVASSLLAPAIAPTRYDFANIAESLQQPSVRHWLGTDAVGRDVLSRLLYGGRTSLEVVLSVVGLGITAGGALGLLAGFSGGPVEYVVLRLAEILTALPTILFAMLLLSILGSGVGNVILALAATAWIEPCRLMRAQALALKNREYVEASRALGATAWRLIRCHIVPNAIGPLIVVVTVSIPKTVFAEAGLSFLGLGISDPLPSWGKMVGESVSYLEVYPILGLAPAALIAATVLSFALVGDGVRDALDPSH